MTVCRVWGNVCMTVYVGVWGNVCLAVYVAVWGNVCMTVCRVWGNGCTCYLLTQLWVNFSFSWEMQRQRKKDTKA